MNIHYKIAKSIEDGFGVAEVIITKKTGSSPGKTYATMYVFESGEIIGTVGGGITEKKLCDLALEHIKLGTDTTFSNDYSLKNDLACGGSVDGFIKVYLPKKKLIIFGSGHVGQAVCNVFSNLLFDVTVIDDRSEFMELECFKNVKYINKEIPDAVKDIQVDNNTYIIVTTRSHKLDTETLISLKDTKPKYIGMIGSRKKAITVYQDIEKEGVSKEFISQVKCPIGYKFDDGSPAEIAISICGQILACKNNKTEEK